MTIKAFQGQVKVSDIQAAFDEIIGRINKIVESYNASEDVKDIDYTKGKGVLSPEGYTLTVGGLKKVLGAYEGCLIGGKVFRVNSTQAYITEGLYITFEKVFRIHSQLLSIGNSTELYLNTDTGTLTVTNTEGNNLVLLTSLDRSRTDKPLNNIKSTQLEKVSGYKLTTQNRGISKNSIDADTENKGRFINCDVYAVNSKTWNNVTVFGYNIASGTDNGDSPHRGHVSPILVNFLFVPKGMKDPFTRSGDAFRNIYKATLQKPE